MTKANIEKTPRELTLLSEINLEAAASASADGQAVRPRKFHMDAYTGGALALAGWRFPVVVDLDGLSIRGGAKVYLEHDRSARVGHLEAVNVLGGRLQLKPLCKSLRESLSSGADAYQFHDTPAQSQTHLPIPQPGHAASSMHVIAKLNPIPLAGPRRQEDAHDQSSQ